MPATVAASDMSWTRRLLTFLGCWTLVPAACRLIVLWSQSVDDVGWLKLFSSIAWVLVVSLPQDLAVGVQALVAVVVLRNLARWAHWPRAEGWATLGGIALFALLQCYLLIDFHLYMTTGVRLDYGFLGMAPSLDTMSSSARALGFGWLLGGLLALPLLLWGCYRATRGLVSVWPARGATWPWLIAGLVLGLLSRGWLQAELSYATSNLVLNDQVNLVHDLFHGGLPWSDDLSESETLKLLEPQAEQFTRPDPRFPLLKQTSGFEGPKTFELRLQPGERPHVLLFLMESFRAADIGRLGGRHNATPNFDRLADQGILFRNFYGNGVQTTRGALATLFGLLPRFSTVAEQVSLVDTPLIGLADLLQGQGYRTGYFQSGSLDFESQDQFFGRHGYHELHGQPEMEQRYPHATRTSWGLHDEYLVRYLVDWLAACDAQGQPALATALSITNHHPWEVPADFPPPQFPGASGTYHQMLETFSYADHCLGLLLELLRQRGLDRRTILVVLADTGTPMGEHHGNFMEINYLYEENIHIPLLLLAPGRIDQPRELDTLGSQIDLLPTLMDLLELTGPNHALGTSLLREVPHRRVWANNPFCLRHLATREGPWKFVLDIKSHRHHLYHLPTDPSETADQAAAQRELATRMSQQALSVHRLLWELYQEGRFVDQATVDAVRQGRQLDRSVESATRSSTVAEEDYSGASGDQRQPGRVRTRTVADRTEP